MLACLKRHRKEAVKANLHESQIGHAPNICVCEDLKHVEFGAVLGCTDFDSKLSVKLKVAVLSIRSGRNPKLPSAPGPTFNECVSRDGGGSHVAGSGH